MYECRSVSPALLTLNTLGPPLLLTLSLGVMCDVVVGVVSGAVSATAVHAAKGTSYGDSTLLLRAADAQRALRVSLLRLSVLSHSFARSTTSLFAVLCATVLRGHIVMWAVVAPRFVFELLFAATTCVGLVGVTLLGVRH